MTEKDITDIAEAKVVQVFGDFGCEAIGILVGLLMARVLVKNGERYHTVHITLDASKRPELHDYFKPVNHG